MSGRASFTDPQQLFDPNTGFRAIDYRPALEQRPPHTVDPSHPAAYSVRDIFAARQREERRMLERRGALPPGQDSGPSLSSRSVAEGLIVGPGPAVNFRDFGESVQSANHARHAAAVRDNQDGGPYLKAVILEHLESLSLEDKKEFKEKMASFDEAIFTLIPLITLKRAVTSSSELTKETTPHFLHKYLKSLCLIQQHWQRSGSQTDDQTLQRALGSITAALCRDPACIASIQMALSSL